MRVSCRLSPPKVVARVVEWILAVPIGAGDDAEAKAEEIPELTLPVADEARRRDDEHPLDEPAEQHLPDVETRHDGLPGARIVGEEEAQPRVLKEVVVDRDELVWEQVDQRCLGCEERVEQIGVRQAVTLGHQPYDLAIGLKRRGSTRQDLEPLLYLGDREDERLHATGAGIVEPDLDDPPQALDGAHQPFTTSVLIEETDSGSQVLDHLVLVRSVLRRDRQRPDSNGTIGLRQSAWIQAEILAQRDRTLLSETTTRCP